MDGLKFFIEGMAKLIRVLVGVVIICIVALVVLGIERCQSREQEQSIRSSMDESQRRHVQAEADNQAAKKDADWRTQAATCLAAAPICEDTDVGRAKRNIVWRTLNGEVLDGSPERELATSLRWLMRPSQPMDVSAGIVGLANRYNLHTEQELSLVVTLQNGSSEERAATLDRILENERMKMLRLDCILRDKERVRRAIARQPIPLE